MNVGVSDFLLIVQKFGKYIIKELSVLGMGILHDGGCLGNIYDGVRYDKPAHWSKKLDPHWSVEIW